MNVNGAKPETSFSYNEKHRQRDNESVSYTILRLWHWDIISFINYLFLRMRVRPEYFSLHAGVIKVEITDHFSDLNNFVKCISSIH